MIGAYETALYTYSTHDTLMPFYVYISPCLTIIVEHIYGNTHTHTYIYIDISLYIYIYWYIYGIYCIYIYLYNIYIYMHDISYHISCILISVDPAPGSQLGPQTSLFLCSVLALSPRSRRFFGAGSYPIKSWSIL